jgi:hypothetical protein
MSSSIADLYWLDYPGSIPLSPQLPYSGSYSLASRSSNLVLYRTVLVDARSSPKNNDSEWCCAVLLVPQGREHEYLFGDVEGRRKLTKDSGYARIVFVYRDRYAGYVDLQTIKQEISERMLELLPRGYEECKLPFISVGHSIGRRDIVEEVDQCIVEDVKVEDEQDYWERRLVFTSNLNLIQSEIRLDVNKRFMFGYLPCGYQKGIAAALGFLEREEEMAEMKGVIIGLGGGVLASFFAHHLPILDLDVVDLDQNIANIAEKHFGFVQTPKMRLHIMDGLEYIAKEAENLNSKRHIVIVDVNTNDSSQALSCPPKPFVESQFLSRVKDILIPGGLCIVNVVTRDSKVRDEIQSTLQSVYGKCVYQLRIDEDVNRIFVAVNTLNASEFSLGDFESVSSNIPEFSPNNLEPEFISELHDILKTAHFHELLSKSEKEKLRKKALRSKKKAQKRK